MQVRDRQVVVLQRERTQLHGDHRALPGWETRDVVRRARHAGGAGHAAQAEDRHALHVQPAGGMRFIEACIDRRLAIPVTETKMIAPRASAGQLGARRRAQPSARSLRSSATSIQRPLASPPRW